MGLVGGTKGWKGDSCSDVQDVSSLARREDVVVRMCSFDTLFITNFQQVSLQLLRLSVTLQGESSGGHSGVFAVVSWQDLVQGLAVSRRRDGVVSSEV